MRVAAVHHWMRNYPEALEYYDRGDRVGTRVEQLPTCAKPGCTGSGGRSGEGPERARGPASQTSPVAILQWGWFWQRFYEGHFQAAIDGLDAPPTIRLLTSRSSRHPKSCCGPRPRADG